MAASLQEALGARALELCRIPSPTGAEGPLADHVEAWAKARLGSARVTRRSHSLLVGDPDDPRPPVALVGHLDTVPPHPEDGPARIEGERLFGLGSSDMKGGLAVMMGLCEALDPARLPYNLLLLFYEREEAPYDQSGLIPLLAALPVLRRVRLGIALEPTDNVVQVGCVGSIHATLRFRGQSAHSARPWQGENAVHKAGALLAELAGRPPVAVEQGGFTFQEVFSITQAHGGRARNVVPELFELNLNYRFAPGKPLASAKRDVEALVDGRAEVIFTDLAPSGGVCADNPLFRRLLELTGLPAASKQAWTDVARFAEAGVDAVNFGPGQTAQAHQANESASVPALALAYERLSAFLTDPAPPRSA